MSRTSAHRAHTMGLLDFEERRGKEQMTMSGGGGPQAMEGWTVLGLKPSFPVSCYEDYKGEERGREGEGPYCFRSSGD